MKQLKGDTSGHTARPDLIESSRHLRRPRKLYFGPNVSVRAHLLPPRTSAFLSCNRLTSDIHTNDFGRTDLQHVASLAR